MHRFNSLGEQKQKTAFQFERRFSKHPIDGSIVCALSHMKTNYLFRSFIIALIFSLGACQGSERSEVDQQDSNLIEKSPEQELPISNDGITLEMEKKQYQTSADATTVYINNKSDTTLTTGKQIRLEKRVNGVWYNFPYSADLFTEEGMLHSAGKTSSMTVLTSDLEHDLSLGQYRAVFGGVPLSGENTYVRGGVAAPFEVIKSK